MKIVELSLFRGGTNYLGGTWLHPFTPRGYQCTRGITVHWYPLKFFHGNSTQSVTIKLGHVSERIHHTWEI